MKKHTSRIIIQKIPFVCTLIIVASLLACGGGGGGGGGGGSGSGSGSGNTNAITTLDTTDYTQFNYNKDSAVFISNNTWIPDDAFLTYESSTKWSNVENNDSRVNSSFSIIETSNGTNIPTNWTGLISLSGIRDASGVDQFSISNAQMNFTVENKSVLGKTIKRYRSTSIPTGNTALCASLVEGYNSNSTPIHLLYWGNTINTPGNIGIRAKTTYDRGAALISNETNITNLINISEGVYTGFSAGSIGSDIDTVNWNFGEFYANIKITKNLNTIKIELNDPEYHQSDCLINGLSSRKKMAPDFSKISSHTCTAAYDIKTNSFQCITNIENIRIEWRGSFHGPNGRHFGGTMALQGNIFGETRNSEVIAAAFLTSR